MRKPPLRILVTVLAVAALAVAGLVGVAEREPLRATAGSATAALLLAEALLLARLFPVHLAAKTKTTAGTAPLFAIALLLPAPIGICAVAVAMTGAESFKRAPWFQVLFNVSQAVLQVIVGRAIFAAIAGEPRLVQLASTSALGATVIAAAAMFGVNAALVELIVAVQTRSFAAADALRRRMSGLPRELPLFLLAVAGAFAGAHAAWTVVVVAAPVAIFSSLLRGAQEPAAVPAVMPQAVKAGGV